MFKSKPDHDPSLTPNASWTILQLCAAYEALNVRSDEERLAIEEQKLLIMRLVDQKIQREIPLALKVKNVEQPIEPNFLKALLKNSIYACLLVFGVFENTVTSYFFGFNLFALIPALSNPGLILAASIYTVVETLLFYFYEGFLLKEALGLSRLTFSLNQFIEMSSAQLQIAMSINRHLTSLPILMVNNTTYDQCLVFARLINHDLQEKHDIIRLIDSSWYRKALHVGVLLFGALSSLAGTYFLVSAVMTLFTAALVGTPLGWCITLLTVIAGLGFHYAMGMTSMSRALNPDYNKFNVLKKEWSVFKETYPHDLADIQAIKHRFEARKSTGGSCEPKSANESLFRQGHTLFRPASLVPQPRLHDEHGEAPLTHAL